MRVDVIETKSPMQMELILQRDCDALVIFHCYAQGVLCQVWPTRDTTRDSIKLFSVIGTKHCYFESFSAM